MYEHLTLNLTKDRREGLVNQSKNPDVVHSTATKCCERKTTAKKSFQKNSFDTCWLKLTQWWDVAAAAGGGKGLSMLINPGIKDPFAHGLSTWQSMRCVIETEWERDPSSAAPRPAGGARSSTQWQLQKTDQERNLTPVYHTRWRFPACPGNGTYPQTHVRLQLPFAVSGTTVPRLLHQRLRMLLHSFCHLFFFFFFLSSLLRRQRLLLLLLVFVGFQGILFMGTEWIVVALLASVDFFENARHRPSFRHLSPASTAVHSAVKKGNQGEENEHQTLISGPDSSPFAELHVSIEILKLIKQVRIYVLSLKLPSLNSGPQTVFKDDDGK